MYYPPSGIYNDSYAKDLIVVRTRFQWTMLTLGITLVLALPLFPFTSDFILRVAIDMFIVLVAVHGINIVTGYAGQITLGQAAFMVLGGYIAGIMSQEFNLNFWLALLLSITGCVTVGVIFAIPSVKVKEMYLALVTLAAHFIIMWALLYIPEMFGLIWGATGVSLKPASFLGVVFDSSFKFYYLALTFAIVMTFIAKNIARSGLGRAFVAIRDNDKAAEATGININYYKIIAFAICSAYAAVAGTLAAYHIGWISTEAKSLMDTVWMVGMVIVGGIGTTIGPIFGVLSLMLMRQGVHITAPFIERFLANAGVGGIGSGGGVLILAFGLVILLFLIFEPRGMAHRWTIWKSSIRLWPFAY